MSNQNRDQYPYLPMMGQDSTSSSEILNIFNDPVSFLHADTLTTGYEASIYSLGSNIEPGEQINTREITTQPLDNIFEMTPFQQQEQTAQFQNLQQQQQVHQNIEQPDRFVQLNQQPQEPELYQQSNIEQQDRFVKLIQQQEQELQFYKQQKIEKQNQFVEPIEEHQQQPQVYQHKPIMSSMQPTTSFPQLASTVSPNLNESMESQSPLPFNYKYFTKKSAKKAKLDKIDETKAETEPENKPEKKPENEKTFDRESLRDLIEEIDPNERLDVDVEDILLNIADDFIESLVTTSCEFAKHRRSTTLEAKDMMLALEKNWNMWTPGFGTDKSVGLFTGGVLDQNVAASGLPEKCTPAEAHQSKMKLINKALKDD